MEAIRRFTRKQREQPARVPTDTIVPLPEIPAPYLCSVELVFRFDCVLDSQKLRQSLNQLLETGNWRQLGGRLRRRESDRKGRSFDLHVPAQFTAERPGFIYKTAHWDGGINQHPVASKIPRAADAVSAWKVREGLAPLVSNADLPRTVDDWIHSDFPALFFEQINFHDATLLLVLYPHHLMDATGYGLFLRSWVAVLNGGHDKILQIRSFSEDPFDRLTEKTPAERYVWHDHLVKGLSALVFIARFLWENISAKEERVVCVPGALIDELRAEILRDLSTSQEAPFVSDGDVLVAWFTRLVLSGVNPSQRRSFVVTNAFSIRSVLPLSPVYLMNAVFLAHTILPVGEVLSQPVSFLAAEYRRALLRERTVEQIEARSAWAKEVGVMPTVGSSDMFRCFVTNWSKGGFFELDFSPAAVRHQEFPKAGTPCTPSIMYNSSRTGRLLPRLGIILGKDYGGNWWTQWYLPKSTWVKIEPQLRSIHQTMAYTTK